MNQLIKTFLLGLPTAWFLATPICLAQNTETSSTENLDQLVQQAGVAAEQLIVWLANFAGAIIVGMIVWGGIKYMQGNTDGGKKTILSAIVGAVIVLLAYAIVQSFKEVITSG
ncbi:MAG: TrbC/VirB2 family protein [Patescibacteria group bacterium]|nr:TrbC/VirB2 family protein [Patescibacteria group bacterium]